MHDKIKEIAILAGYKHKDAVGQCEDYAYFDHEKFAELLIRECIGCCEQAISDPVPEYVDTWFNGGSQCIEEIKQHFGVSDES